jgi:starch synthase
LKILFAASEAYPLVKTGGLGDVIYGLPKALVQQGNEVRLVLPAYGDIKAQLDDINELGRIKIKGAGRIHHARILETQFDEQDIPLILVDIPVLFDRKGNPYTDTTGDDWPDNAERFAVFSHCVAQLGMDVLKTGWKPDVVHCNDWQTGLVPAYLSEFRSAPKTVFTIHNLAYGGNFSREEFKNLGLPKKWWSPKLVEFYDGFSMLKAGLVFSDSITTVSPTYASEICTPEAGYGFDGVLRQLNGKLSGILNGVDDDIWNPRWDGRIHEQYGPSYRRIKAKKANKNALLKSFGLPETDAPVLGFVGRLVDQKGIDLILYSLPELIATTDAVVIILGEGQRKYEDELKSSTHRFPGRLAVYIGYSEDHAHEIEAGADIFLMPSRNEPCGLNQMYSLKYGTPPVVHNTGGLADTVVDTNKETLEDKSATGFVFYELTASAFQEAIHRAIKYYHSRRVWQQICRTGMQQDFGWERSASEYAMLYKH